MLNDRAKADDFANSRQKRLNCNFYSINGNVTNKSVKKLNYFDN